MQILQYLINGISIGAVYAIIALGYTMVYGIAKMLNFAHGDIIMVGAYISFCVTNYLGLPAFVSVIAAMAVCTLLGILIEKLAYMPLRGTPSLAVLITAIGVSYFLQNGAQLIWGSAPKNFASIVPLKPVFLAGGELVITGEVIVTILASVLIMVGLTLFTTKTKIGKAMRAVSEDRAAAQLMGISVNNTISMTFAIGSALAAIAGVLLCSTVPTLQPTTGAMPGIRAFTAAVFGGIGSIPGAMLGGILLGIIETFSKAFISTQFSDAIVFSVLIIILLVKPAGLLGKQIQEKV
ncbi:MAG: branched-chain amino acid ABC transporter permease [Oscillospiraceae bacterium]|nr:branched-chain amino acid ABC transporter permease [Oscillospiraceae bacterium]MBQ7130362.1 branched-chain amino acid ABC transporter permease [Oscillospiraceae bacterium]